MKQYREHSITMGLLALEIIALFAFFSLFPTIAFAGIGTPNATVITQLDIGNSFPEILNVSIDDDAATITLNPNATKRVSCVAVIADYNGEDEIDVVNATFYDTGASSMFDSDDNNTHYTNSSCVTNDSFGSYNGYNDDSSTTLANCTLQVQYYANPQVWACHIMVNDTFNTKDNATDSINISQLLSIELPDTLHFGTINATTVSGENLTNITNVGNTAVNISFEGYARTQNDGFAMNCTLGSLENISVEYEKYNLTSTSPTTLTHDQFIGNYTNLTTNPVIRDFRVPFRQNETVNEAVNSTYWRIYVPQGVAGTCAGNIIFGATVASGV